MPATTLLPINSGPQARCAGFTLVEILIAVVIVGVLAVVAFPTFLDSIRKGRRAEAFAAIAAAQQGQERWRGNNSSYTAALATAPPNGLGLPATTPSSYYAISLINATATGYDVMATATAGTSQANDGACKLIGVRMTGGAIKYGSGESSIDWSAATPDMGHCWAR